MIIYFVSSSYFKKIQSIYSRIIPNINVQGELLNQALS